MNRRMFVGVMMLFCSATVAQAQLTYVSQFHEVRADFAGMIRATSGTLFWEGVSDNVRSVQLASVQPCGLEVSGSAIGQSFFQGSSGFSTFDVQFVVGEEHSFTLTAITGSSGAFQTGAIEFLFTGGEFNEHHVNESREFFVSGVLRPSITYRLRLYCNGASGGLAGRRNSGMSAVLDIGKPCDHEVRVCHPDQDGDEIIGLGDIAEVITHWGRGVAIPFRYGDANGDMLANAADVSVLLSMWGQDCPAR